MNYTPNYTAAIAMGTAEPALKYGTDVQLEDADGRPLVNVEVAFASADAKSEIVRVRVPSANVPKGLALASPVRFKGLTARPWSSDGRAGMSFSAEAIEAGGATAS